MTHAQPSCAFTYSIEVFNNATSSWDAINAVDHDFYRSQTSNSLTIGVVSGSYPSYRPTLYYAVRVIWSSTYSEMLDSQVPPADTVFYDGGNCDGASWTQSPNADGTPLSLSSGSMPSWNNIISSVKIPSGYTVNFYDGDLSGSMVSISGQSDASGPVCQKLVNFGFDNTASSLKFYQKINAVVEEQFKIVFRDPCLENQISLNSNLPDATYHVVSNAVTRYSIDYTSSVSETVCPLTATCLIYSELQDDWISCDNTPGGPYTTKDAKASRWHNAFDSSQGHLDVLYTLANYRADNSSPYPDTEYQVKIRIEDLLSMDDSNFVEDTFTLTF